MRGAPGLEPPILAAVREIPGLLPTIWVGFLLRLLWSMLIFLATSADVLVSVPDAGPGNWAGGASCVLVDGIFWLAYRIRRPLNSGRGVGVVVAKSGDGVNFKPVCEVSRDAFGASLEHPVILPADVGWRRISVERPRTPSTRLPGDLPSYPGHLAPPGKHPAHLPRASYCLDPPAAARCESAPSPQHPQDTPTTPRDVATIRPCQPKNGPSPPHF